VLVVVLPLVEPVVATDQFGIPLPLSCPALVSPEKV
jgi:hypothetical protein